MGGYGRIGVSRVKDKDEERKETKKKEKKARFCPISTISLYLVH